MKGVQHCLHGGENFRRMGKIFAWVLYLFLFYCLTLAYVVGCGKIFHDLFPDKISLPSGQLLFLLLFVPFVYAGSKLVGRLNYLLMLGLAIFYLAFVFVGTPEVQLAHLTRQNWSLALLGLPITFTAFAFQGIIPTLVSYLNHDARKVRLSIWIRHHHPFNYLYPLAMADSRDYPL